MIFIKNMGTFGNGDLGFFHFIPKNFYVCQMIILELYYYTCPSALVLGILKDKLLLPFNIIVDYTQAACIVCLLYYSV